MVQFKKVFLGEDPGPTPGRQFPEVRPGRRQAQRPGKRRLHRRHHTFFEMLGNFSFGDYFKEGAIEMAWDLLTQHYKLPADKLWATVFHEDEEAARLWEKITGLPPSRIIGLGEKDNFWAMGDTGPCAPAPRFSSTRARICPAARTAASQVRMRPVSRNLEQRLHAVQPHADGVLTPLPKPSIDTGMGLERLAAVIQGVKSNFDCDLLRPVIAGIESLSGQAYGASETQNVPFRVIADHSRATAFLIADGVLPSNEAGATCCGGSCAGPSASGGS